MGEGVVNRLPKESADWKSRFLQHTKKAIFCSLIGLSALQFFRKTSNENVAKSVNLLIPVTGTTHPLPFIAIFQGHSSFAITFAFGHSP